ncbi:MAG TPA: ABC transporter permease [Bryobacteraceae bacterium]|nr:ABC transporter permease [Bryobacteraceae bacterium]
MANARKLYGLLLKLFPARFREEYATPLERQFCDDYRDLPNRGARALFWLTALADLAVSIPKEFTRELRQDIAYSLRVYRHRRTSTALAFVALALAIGATTGVFSVMNAVLLRSLPFREPQRLVELSWFPQPPFQGGDVQFRAWRGANPYLDDASVYVVFPMNLNTGREGVRVRVAETSANFFETLGTEVEFGRPFAPGEDTPGSDSVAVISYGLWQQVYGGDPRVLGSTIRLSGVQATIVGVAPPSMDYPERTAVWTPTIFDIQRLPISVPAWHDTTIGRLKSGVSWTRGNQMYQAEMHQRIGDRRLPGTPALVPLQEQLAGHVREASLVLMGIVVSVLLIACANVAHLLLSRITERRQELEVRSALGASRGRLIQQLITESTLLTLGASIAGLAVAHLVARLASVVEPVPMASQQYTVLDGAVLAFALSVATLTGLLFGVLPAGLLARMQPAADLVRVQPNTHGVGVRRVRGTLIAIQAALTVILLAGALAMGRNFLVLTGTDMGFRTDHAVAMTVSLSGTRPEAQKSQRQFYEEVLDRLRAVPGVESAGAVAYLPLTELAVTGTLGFRVDGDPIEHGASLNYATPDYFRAMETPIVAGRDFTPSDAAGTEPVVIVNQEFARQLGGDVVGRGIRMTGSKTNMRIVGLVRTARLFGPAGPAVPQIFLLASQSVPDFLTYVIRVRGNAVPYVSICRDVVRQLDAEVPVYDANTLEGLKGNTLARARFYTTVVSFLGGLALLLAVLGIYGVASFSIVQRTHEIGVCLAVGATPRRLRAMLLRQSLIPVAAGTLAGVAGAVLLGRWLEHLTVNTAPLDPTACGIALFTLATTAAGAVWKASRRVVRMDPMSILRAE